MSIVTHADISMSGYTHYTHKEFSKQMITACHRQL